MLKNEVFNIFDIFDKDCFFKIMQKSVKPLNATIHTSEHDITCRHKNLVRQFSVNFEHVLKAFYSNSSCYYTIQYIQGYFCIHLFYMLSRKNAKEVAAVRETLLNLTSRLGLVDIFSAADRNRRGGSPFHQSWARGATLLPRQCYHIFRPQSCWLWQYYYISYGYSI